VDSLSRSPRDPRRLHRFRARLCLQQTLDRYRQPLPSLHTDLPTQGFNSGFNSGFDAGFNQATTPVTRQGQQQGQQLAKQLAKQQRDRLVQLQQQIDKLDRGVFRFAVFGAVSRGKSALINALVGRDLLATGPTNGVTQWPQTLIWDEPFEPPFKPPFEPIRESTDTPAQPFPVELRVELIDTPGIDEISGEARADSAFAIAQQVDAILFVVSGDVTQTEYQALCRLWQAQKPLLVVFNKIDLYPDLDREAIVQRLQALGDRHQLPLRPEEVILTAAQPAPVLLSRPGFESGFTPNFEQPSGQPTEPRQETWITPPPQIEPLRTALRRLVQTEGETLLALNALTQARQLEVELAATAIRQREQAAEALIWNFVRTKAAIVGLNPLLVLDVLGGTVTDLLCIRQLAKLYGLPMTSHQAGKLLKTILWSNGGLLLGELLGGMAIGAGKSLGPPGFVGSAIAQAGIAGTGLYFVAQAAQRYLQQGCTWGPLGADTVMQRIFTEIDRDSLCDRLKREFTADRIDINHRINKTLNKNNEKLTAQ